MTARARRFVALTALVAFAAAAAPAQTPESVERELETVRGEIREIGERLAHERRQREREQAALAEAESELSRRTRELRETAAALDEARARLQTLDAEARTAALRADEQRAELADHLRIAYRLGNRSRLRTLLATEDPSRVSRQLAILGYLGRSQAESVRRLRARLVELESLREAQQAERDRLAALQLRQAAALEARSEALRMRQAALEELEGTIRTREQRLESLARSEAELEALLEDLSGVLADIPPDVAVEPFASLRGRLAMPLDGPVAAGYADRRAEQLAWEGWLIRAAPGDPVRAVAHGRVAYADWLRGYGMMLILDHGDGYMTLYGRNQALLADVGDWVAPGEVIALAGSSGGGPEPGLYFQIRHEGRPVDPAPWMSRRAGAD
ncbi:MAG: peptidoglycan DD-metalloendopeptidase family protein [Wenzhouxiangellaceae bacterium]|nr:peptidoglycan DD-metalloendopeptidase family protein [Wenzhouxiangellaceae bacterium]